MAARILGIILGLMVLLVLAGGNARRGRVPPPPPPPVALPGEPPPPPRTVSLLPNPAASAPERGTPTIDLLAILAVRRRIEREGRRIYLSEMFAETDSVVVRWPDRPSRTYTVLFVPDTLLPGWTAAALDDARRGLQLWGATGSVSLAETRDTAIADIVVRWTRRMPNPQEAGHATLEWSGGEVRRGSVELALWLNDSTRLTGEERRRAAGHEFGHALGLPHSTDPRDFMHPRSEENAPSRRDLATLLLLYAVPPGSLKTP